MRAATLHPAASTSSSFPGVATENVPLTGTLSGVAGTRGGLALGATSGNRSFVVYIVSPTRIFALETDGVLDSWLVV